jgi:hypothetical protein
MDERSPQKDDPSPKKDEGSPKKDGASSEKGEGSPKKDEASPQMDEGSPKKDDPSPEKDGGSSIWYEGSPHINPGLPEKTDLRPKAPRGLRQRGEAPTKRRTAFPHRRVVPWLGSTLARVSSLLEFFVRKPAMLQILESIELRILVDQLSVEHQGQRRDPGIGHGESPLRFDHGGFPSPLRI